MHNLFKKFFFLFVLLPLLSFAYADKYAKTLVTKSGDTFQMIPLQNTKEDLDGYIEILTDPDTTSTMRDLKPWPISMIKSTFDYYVASWGTFEDLKKIGIQPDVMGLAFVVHKNGKVIASGGIQRSTRGEDPPEIYFAILPPYRAKGLGTAFAKAIMKFFEQQFGKRVMEAIVRPTNTPSKKLLAKLGFKPMLDSHSKPIIKNFPNWNNTEYAVYRCTP
ncbi:MAG: GNAT family N-acetyltransferase [Alphaproteobacteria bacterium]